MSSTPATVATGLADNLQILPTKLVLKELAARLKQYEKSKRTFNVLNSANAGIKFQDYNDFCQRGIIAEEREVRIYTVSGHNLKIIICEDYAQKLDEIRDLRLSLEAPETDKLSEISDKLATNPLGKRALPEDLLAYIDQLPDSGYFSNLILLNERNVVDTWIQQSYSAGFISSAAVEPNGDLLFFQRDIDEFIRADLFHEWGHGLEKRSTLESDLFSDAVSLEMAQTGAYHLSTYASRNNNEHWAVLIEHLLGEDYQRFLNAVEKAALRSATLVSALKKALQAETAQKSTQILSFEARVSHAENTAIPKAKLLLESLAEKAKQELITLEKLPAPLSETDEAKKQAALKISEQTSKLLNHFNLASERKT